MGRPSASYPGSQAAGDVLFTTWSWKGSSDLHSHVVPSFGLYSAIVRGIGGETAVKLIEVFEVN